MVCSRDSTREGGYTRIMKLAKLRRGDSADMAMIEFIDRRVAFLFFWHELFMSVLFYCN
jgi:Ribosomal protein L17